MVAHLRHHYFKELMAAGHHILHTIPVWKTHHGLSPYAVTDVSFHVFSEVKITRQTLTRQSRLKEPVIIIVGMTGNRPMPAMTFSGTWLATAGRLSSFGVVCISADIFLKPKLLKLFSHINATTTMIPVFTGVNKDNWGLDMIAWHEHGKLGGQPCEFELHNKHPLQYRWRHHEGWTYEHSGNTFLARESYTVACAFFFRSRLFYVCT